MYTPEDCENIVISYLQASAGIAAIQLPTKGGITRGDLRGINSDVDLVVTTLSLIDGDVQLAIVNVTTWIKEVKEDTGEVFRGKPDIAKFDAMNRAAVEALGGKKGKFWPNGNLYISNISNSKFKNAETKEFFSNIRVSMRMHDTTN